MNELEAMLEIIRLEEEGFEFGVGDNIDRRDFFFGILKADIIPEED